MKNLILILSLCFILFSCFEKEEEVTVVPETPIDEGNVMQCNNLIKFISKINSYPIPQVGEDRASIKKYSFKNKIAYLLNPTEGSYWLHAAPIVISSRCDTLCLFSIIPEDNTCADWGQATLIETIWQDPR